VVLGSLVAAAAAGGLYLSANARTPAPSVTFISLKGEKLAAAALRGRVALVNFWATDCPVCVKEMPQMVNLYNKYHGRGFELIAVAMKYDPPNYVIRYVEKNALPFTVALDPLGELAKAFGKVEQTPTTFVIDKRGNIVSRIVGEPDFDRLHRLLEQQLNETAELPAS
jgi:peroxiredoxin